MATLAQVTAGLRAVEALATDVAAWRNRSMSDIDELKDRFDDLQGK
jgi:hypothetical protein